MPPFIVMGTPRSRTAWFARFLTVPFVQCEHEPSVRWRSRSDLWAFLERDDHGASDASLTWFWRDILAFRPDARLLMIRRPVAEVRASARRVGIPLASPDGLDVLDSIAAEACGFSPQIMSVSYADLARPTLLDAAFRHCLRQPPPAGWVDAWAGVKIEVPWRPRYAEGNANMEGFLRLFRERGQPVPTREARR